MTLKNRKHFLARFWICKGKKFFENTVPIGIAMRKGFKSIKCIVDDHLLQRSRMSFSDFVRLVILKNHEGVLLSREIVSHV